MKQLFFILVLFFTCQFVLAQSNPTDSLSKLLDTQEGEQRIATLKKLSDVFKNDKPKQALEYAQELLDIAIESKSAIEEAEAMRLMGNIYRAQSKFPVALDNYLKALKIFEKATDKKAMVGVYNSIGIIYFYQKNDSTALHYYSLSTQLAQEINDQQGLANTYNNIGNIFNRKEDFKSALDYLQKALVINRKLDNKEFVASNLLNIGYVYLDDKKYDKTLKYGLEALKVNEKLGDMEAIAATLCFIASVYRATDSLDKAQDYANEALQYATAANAKLYIQQASETLYHIYKDKKDYENALIYYHLFNASKDSLESEETRKEIVKIQFNSDLEKKQSQIDFLNEEKKLSDYIRNLLGFGLAIAFGLLVIVFTLVFRLSKISAKRKKQAKDLENANRQISFSHRVLAEQKEIIEQKKSDIDSSIHYAKRIQDAILPYDETIARGFSEHFVILRPRDTVSGDFYWYTETEPQPMYAINPDIQGKPSIFKGFTNEKQIIVAVDCTGHGIPGAFMSMIGNSLLNEIVIEKGVSEPDRILNLLHKSIRKSLKQEEQKTYDGMDVALCTIDYEKKIMEYAGAHNPLIYVQDKQLFQIKGDGYGIGGHQMGRERIFTKHIIDISKPTTFYIFSDGFQDQFGGKLGKKFMKSNLYNLLFEISHHSMAEQKVLLEKKLNEWTGDYAQVDDILMVGVKI